MALFALAVLVLSSFAQAGAVPDAERDEFVAVFGAPRPQLDPQLSIYSSEAQIFTAIYEGLFSYDPSTLEPEKAAVESWTRSKDGLVYTFDIKPNARWSDGSPLLARDFRDSWLRMLALDADYAAFFDIIAGAAEYRRNDLADPASVGLRLLSERKLEVTLAAPAAYFTRLLCHHSFAPVHPSMLNRTDWNAVFPIPTNGPYRFVTREKDGYRLERNPEYWDSASVSIPKLRFVFTDEDSLATAMFDGGQAQWLLGPMDLDSLLRQDAVQVNPMFATHYWFFDSSTGPWKDARVRRALALLIPWAEVRSTENYMIPAKTLVLPMPGYAKVKGIEKQDRAEALRLLSDAGHEGGKDLPALRIAIVEGKDTRRVSKLMAEAWKALPDLQVEVITLPPAAYYDRIGRGPELGQFTVAHTTWIGDFADPMAFLQMWNSKSSLNDAGYSDPAYDAKLAASQSAEAQERLDFLAEAETMLLRDAVVLPMYHSFAVSVIDSDYVLGWYQNPLDIHPFKSLKFGDPTVRPNVARLGKAASPD